MEGLWGKAKLVLLLQSFQPFPTGFDSSHQKTKRFFRKTPYLVAAALVIIFVSLALLGVSCSPKVEEESLEPIRIERVSEASAWSGKRSFTVLLLGSDSRSEDIGGRSDAIMLVRINPQTGRAALVSFPRDSRVNVPGFGLTKINNAMAYGGPRLTVRTIKIYSGISIDYYAVTTFKGFVRMMDRIGGLQINIKERINVRFAGAFLPPREQRLNGGQILAYSRARHIPGGDLGRAAHQQHVVIALFEQSQPKSSVFDLMQLIASISSNVSSDLTVREMFYLGKAVFSVSRENIEATVLAGSTQTIGGASYVILNTAEARKVFERVKAL